ncbi:hypothetical protein DB31_7870 [Hyalangium minutum]|uniref:Uncharacterized protein n=1 Tax=Hyalangium minutum TaxID=394096 RepID=A0A085WLS0_9BACT|nr:hypothetical protein DB31_7870 [Hyalangium minutum]
MLSAPGHLVGEALKPLRGFASRSLGPVSHGTRSDHRRIVIAAYPKVVGRRVAVRMGLLEMGEGLVRARWPA